MKIMKNYNKHNKYGEVSPRAAAKAKDLARKQAHHDKNALKWAALYDDDNNNKRRK